MAAEASADIASRFVEAVELACDPLRHFPLSGAPRPQLAPALRVIFHQPYAIYYTPTAEAVVIVRVLHGSRDVAALAAEGGFEA